MTAQDESVLDETAIDALGTPRQINRMMIRVQRRRHDKVIELRTLMAAKDQAEAAAARAYAEAFLGAAGSIEARKQTAVLAVADLEFDAKTAASLVLACKKSMDVLADDWETCRSAEVDLREEMKVLG